MQVKSILRNRSGIEEWILEKAEERRNSDPSVPPFIYPYDLGWRENIKQVIFLILSVDVRNVVSLILT